MSALNIAALVLFGVFGVVPLLGVFALSLARWDGLGALGWSGVANWRHALTDRGTWDALWLTAKVMAVVAEVMPDGELRIAGLGSAPAHGLKRGVVVNIDATVQSIQQALKEAEMMADCKITRVYTGITGSHIRGQNSTGMVIVRDKEVTPVDVTRVVETAKAINIPNDQRLLLVERGARNVEPQRRTRAGRQRIAAAE